jgi:polar amino acid transport system ATP-binding protein
MNILTVDKLHKSFGKLEVLKGIDMTASRGEVVALIGPSGSGKSTLLRCIIGLEKPTSGQIDCDVPQGMVFQNFNLFPHKSVLENLIEAPVMVKKMKREAAVELAMELLGKVGLTDKRDAYPCQLSGGQKQRVAIARALAMQPQILLFDEPTSSLDPKLTREVLQVIADLAREHMTMVIATHEMDFARDIASRVLFMKDGVIRVEGTAKEVLGAPRDPELRSFLALPENHPAQCD